MTSNTPSEPRPMSPDYAVGLVLAEVESAVRKFPAFNSAHEGWAVIREEVDELWEEVKANQGYTTAARVEAMQIAAMAVRYMLDIEVRRDGDS